MDISKDEINPNKRWCLCKKKGIAGSKGNRFKNKSGWGGAGGRAQRLPPQCVPREKHIGTSLNGYIASKNEKIEKEAHRHKSRWIFWKKKKEKMNPKKRCLWAKGKRVGSKGSWWKNKSGWGGPLQCVTRKNMKEVHRHKSRWRSMKMKWTQITDDKCWLHTWSFLPSFLLSFLPFVPPLHPSLLASFPPSLLPPSLLSSFPPFQLPSFPPSLLSSFPPSFPSLLPSFLPSLLSSFPPSLLISFLPSFLPACLPSFLPSLLFSFPPSLLPSFPPSLLSSFPPSFLPSLLPSFLPSLLSSFLPSLLPPFLHGHLFFFDASLFFLMHFYFFDASPDRSQRGPKPLFTTPFGGRYHCDRECHGLRHAKEVCLTPRCHRCGPQSDVPQHRLYAISHGYALHVGYEHCRDAGSNGPLRAFNPCAICCTADDRLVMTCLEGLSWICGQWNWSNRGSACKNSMHPYLPNSQMEILPLLLWLQPTGCCPDFNSPGVV